MRRAVFQCECGNKCVSWVASVKSRDNPSCGCRIGIVLREYSKEFNPSKIHGMSNTSTYNSWSSMIQRCTNETVNSYPDYGGRGITVCDRWLNSFLAFYEDMGERPKNHTLDRIKNDEGYSKENCRWATKKQQSNNRRSNHFIVIGGESKTISEWSELSGVSKVTIKGRIKAGYLSPTECVFNKPLGPRERQRK